MDLEQELDYAEPIAAEIAARVHARQQGERCVLLVKGDRYYEVIAKEGDDLTLQSWNRFFHDSLNHLEVEGFHAVPALRIIKANGTWTYAVKDGNYTDWYVAGKCHPQPRGSKALR